MVQLQSATVLRHGLHVDKLYISSSLVMAVVLFVLQLVTPCQGSANEYPKPKVWINNKNKNAMEVDIPPASGKITKNMKYRSRAPGQGVF